MLDIQHLTKIYRSGTKAVDDLSLTVDAGDIFAFIGPNGAGKTTTIKSVVGIMEFNSGEIYIDGRSILQDPVGCKQVTAYIPDNPDLYDGMKGIEFLNFICDVFSVPSSSREKRISRYADALGLADNLGSLIGSYSHGMKQKLAVISALVHEPKLMILDEPFVGLDPRASFTLKEFMHELTSQGSAIFYSTHVLEVAEKLCDKVAIIQGGRIIASGTMEEVRGNQSLEHVFLELTEDAEDA
ncbi:MAG: ABC transporter ATP-binding protein [Clostridia bacterium]|nr:ABC transporter ATP-binding protein [Clostridia bacterium]